MSDNRAQNEATQEELAARYPKRKVGHRRGRDDYTILMEILWVIGGFLACLAFWSYTYPMISYAIVPFVALNIAYLEWATWNENRGQVAMVSAAIVATVEAGKVASDRAHANRQEQEKQWAQESANYTTDYEKRWPKPQPPEPTVYHTTQFDPKTGKQNW